MSTTDFLNIRRQKFLPEKYFALNIADLPRQIELSREAIGRRLARGNHKPTSQSLILINRVEILTLMYTGGAPIESLVALYRDVIDAAEELTAAQREYIAYLGRKSGEDLIDNASPLPLGDFESYRTAIDIVSLGILLGDGDGLRRFVKLLDIDRGRDMLFEAIIETAVDDPSDNNEFLHVRPYEPLLDAFCTAETPAEAAAFMKTFLDSWYKSFETLPWHNGHLKVPADESYLPYYGYWAFEAAAVSVLFNIDDTPFRDHLLYPKDLADWARANHSTDHVKPGATSLANNYRCEAGHPCPTSGFWSTPAKNSSRQYFKQGTVMPAVASAYGATIWQWDRDQSDPSLS